MATRTYKNGITVDVYKNGWIFISRQNAFNETDHEKYLYYTPQEALKKFKAKYNL